MNKLATLRNLELTAYEHYKKIRALRELEEGVAPVKEKKLSPIQQQVRQYELTGKWSKPAHLKKQK